MATLDKDLLAIQEMRDAVTRANSAQAAYLQFSQQQVDTIVKAVADAAFKEADRLAKMAVQETGMGIPNHKKMKNEVASRDVYEDIKDLKTVGVIGVDHLKKKLQKLLAIWGYCRHCANDKSDVNSHL